MSYGNNVTTVQLDNTGTTLIVGEDLDNTSNGQGANGVGKSTIINAVTYAMYDKPISNISKDNLVNNINKKHMEVTVTFTAPNGKMYAVKRTRKTKAGAAGNAVYIYEEGKDVTPDSSANANLYIERLVGIPYELFVRIVVFSASHTPFLDLPTTSHYAANQRDIIEELFGLTMLTTKAEQLKEIIKDTEGRLATNKNKIDAQEREAERYNTQLESAKRRVLSWDVANTETIDELKAKLSAIATVNIEEQHELHNQLTAAQAQLTDTQTARKAIDKNIKTATIKYKKLCDELSHLQDSKCPYCLQQYADSQSKIADVKTQVDEHQAQLHDMNAQIVELDAQLDGYLDTYDTIKSKITVSNINELISIRNQSTQIETKIQELEVADNPYIEPLNELLAMAVEPANYDVVNKITKELEHQKFLLKLLTKKDSFVRKTLLNKNIPFLNQKLQHYLAVLGLPHKVEFTYEMTASISQFGHELDFGNLSAGQRARVNLALSFAFRDVLQNMHTKVNICMLDEALDHGLDSVGVQAAIKMLKRKAREDKMSMFVITHREVDSAFDYTMTVQLSKGFSSILYEVLP